MGGQALVSFRAVASDTGLYTKMISRHGGWCMSSVKWQAPPLT